MTVTARNAKIAAMQGLARSLSLLLCAWALAACGTTNLVQWVQDKPSVLKEPKGELSRAVIKPLVTLTGFPVAIAFDVVTFPFQLVGGVHPFGPRMAPDSKVDL